MMDMIPAWLARVVLVLAPLILALSIVAYLRLRRHIYSGPDPVVFFRHFRWNSVLIALGGIFLFREAAWVQASGSLAQVCGLALAFEFFYVAYANIQVVMSTRGVLLGMRFVSWRRFAGYQWVSEADVELRSHQEKRHRLRVPAPVRQKVVEVVDQNILR